MIYLPQCANKTKQEQASNKHDDVVVDDTFH